MHRVLVWFMGCAAAAAVSFNLPDMLVQSGLTPAFSTGKQATHITGIKADKVKAENGKNTVGWCHAHANTCTGEHADFLLHTHAARKLDYSGAFTLQQGDRIRRFRIAHACHDGTELEKLEILDGEPHECLRNNQESTCYQPQSKTILIENNAAWNMFGLFPIMFGDNPKAILQHYVLKKGEVERVAGKDCQSMLLLPKDDLRYGYQLWVEKATGLPLKIHVLNEKNDVLEAFSFSQISIGKVDETVFKPSFDDTKDWQVGRVVMQDVDLSAWTLKGMPSGFVRIRDVNQLATNAMVSGNPVERNMAQIVYSDGLATLTLFIKKGTQGRTEKTLREGAMNLASRPYGEDWLVIAGTVPPAVIRKVADLVEFNP